VLSALPVPPVFSPPHRHAALGRRLAFWLAALAVLLTLAPAAFGAEAPKIAIVTSRGIKPYEEAIAGFRKQILATAPQAELTTYYALTHSNCR
jgi:hypothetical protein